MTAQNYLVVENNVVTNIVVWDGGSEWIPPTDATMLIQATTPAMIWKWNGIAWALTQVVGAGDIGFSWNDTVLTTNKLQPADPIQPKTTGTQAV